MITIGRPTLRLPESAQADLHRLAGTEPAELLDSYLATAYARGWPYASLAAALGLSRDWVRERARRGVPDHHALPPIPAPPERPARPAPPTLTPIEVARLRDLNTLARQLQSNAPADDPRRLASEELSRFIDALTKRKITYRQIGDAIGVKPMTVRARLKRHGYRKTNPSLKSYQGAKTN